MYVFMRWMNKWHMCMRDGGETLRAKKMRFFND